MLPTSEGQEKKKLVTQDTLESPSLSQTPSLSSEDPLSPVVRGETSHDLQEVGASPVVVVTFTQLSESSASESVQREVKSPSSDGAREATERLPQIPLQEHVFSECSRERILGLLAAMLPPVKQV